MLLNGRRAHFLDVFLPNLSSNRLKVPPKFAHHLGDRTSGSFSLIGPSGNQWRINLFEYDGHFFFREGWPTFVKDHDIQCGDTLVFGYDGDSTFTVQIFDESSCEKDEAFLVNCSQQNCSHGAAEFNEVLGKRIERDNEDLKLELVAEKKMRSSCVSAPQVLPTQKRVHKLKKCAKKKKKLKKTVAIGDDVTSKRVVMASDTTIVLASPALTQTDIENFRIMKSLEVKKFREKKPKKEKTDNQKVPNMLNFIEARAAHYFKSTYPYFVRVMRYSHISGNCTLKIPSRFSSLHLPNCRIKVTIKNLNGDCWIVNSIPNIRPTGTMHTICGGWTAFVRDNNIKIEDVCIFELVGELELRVQILRLGLEELECQLGIQSINDWNSVELGERCLEMIETVAEGASVNPLKDLDETNECETDIQHEATSSIDTVGNPIAVLNPTCASASSIGTVDDPTSDEILLGCDGGGIMAYQTSGDKEQDLQAVHMQPLAEEARDALSFTSPFPSFMKVMASSNVGGSFVLSIPRKFSATHLPPHNSEAILRNLRGDSWNVAIVRDGKQMKFSRGWSSFVRRNNVKLGDVCIFELLGERDLQVHVFGGSQKVQVNVFDDTMASNVSTEWGIPSE